MQWLVYADKCSNLNPVAALPPEASDFTASAPDVDIRVCDTGSGRCSVMSL